MWTHMSGILGLICGPVGKHPLYIRNSWVGFLIKILRGNLCQLVCGLVGKRPLHMPCIRTSWVGFLIKILIGNLCQFVCGLVAGGYFSCCEALTTFFTREMKMTLPHVSLLVFSCCVVFTTFFIREMKMNSPPDSL